MMPARIPLYFLCLFLCGQMASVTAEPQLRFDPFARPDLETLPKPIEVKLTKESVPEVWGARLNATMRSGGHSLANVDGNIIAPGESIEGYRLIEVHERFAVFMKEDKRYVLDLDGTEKEQHERNLSAIK